MSLFQLGHVALHSGGTAEWKVECDALDDGDLAALALMLAEIMPPFGRVEGVPRGGLRIAAALQKYVTKGALLIVDDVCTTGASMEEHRAGREATGAVLFARTSEVPWWVTPLWWLAEPETLG